MLLLILSSFGTENTEETIEKIYREYHGLMMYTANKILKDHALAEDVVSESLVKINRNLHVLDKLACCQRRAYIVNIVRNTSLDFLRKMNKEKIVMDVEEDFIEKIPDKDVDILDGLIAKESCKSIKAAVKSLPKPLQTVVSYVFQKFHRNPKHKKSCFA